MLQRCRSSMQAVCHLTELPEFDGAEDGTIRHMRLKQLEAPLQKQYVSRQLLHLETPVAHPLHSPIT